MEWLVLGALALFAFLALAHQAPVKAALVGAWAVLLLACLWDPVQWLFLQGRLLLGL